MVKYTYDAWGNNVVSNANNVIITGANHIGNLNPFRYRGYYYDNETKLYFLKTRYYDPEIGRFMTIDGIEYLNPETINGLNLYAYCGNNPVMNVDPNGNDFWSWLLAGVAIVFCIAGAVFTGGTSLVGAALIGAAIGGGVSIATQAITTGELNWGQFALDLGISFVSGIVAYGLGNIGSFAGSSFGYSLSQTSIQGLKIGKAFSFLGGPKFIVSAFNTLGKWIGEIVGGYVASEFMFSIYTEKENTSQVVQGLSDVFK